ncbi:MAG TPA: hypothetical protein VHK69_19010 [Chitinophagaceae bacterium]|nr:hypothetical protein [Chitinophagaceae bacterium]
MPALLAQVRPGETDAAVTSPAPFPDEAASWYSSPWIWLGAALVFILLLIALGRGGKTGKANSAASQTGEIRTEKDPDAA